MKKRIITERQLMEETQRLNMISLGYTALQIELCLAEFGRLLLELEKHLGSFDQPVNPFQIELNELLRKQLPEFIRSRRKDDGTQHN